MAGPSCYKLGQSLEKWEKLWQSLYSALNKIVEENILLK